MAVYTEKRFIPKGTPAYRMPLRGDMRPVGYDLPREITVTGTVDTDAGVFEWRDERNQYATPLRYTRNLTA